MEAVNGSGTADDATTLGGRIQMARAARGLTVPQLARRAGVLPETMSNWERDRSEPRVNKLQILAGVLEVPPMWLLGGNTAELEGNIDPSLDETSDLASKVERLVSLHERTTALLFEVQSEIRRLQSEIDKGGIGM